MRPTVFAAAFVAALSIPAVARADAGFAASLGAPLSGLAAMAQLKTQAQKPPQAEAPTAPGDVWKNLIAKVMRDGTKGAADGFSTRSLTAGAPGAVHGVVVYYVPGAGDAVKVVGAELTLERSALETGVIRTDYWLLLVKPSGRVDEAVYRQRVDVPGQDVIPGTPAVVDLADPRVKARFDEMLGFWTTR